MTIRRRSRVLSAVALVLFIWARLALVADVPRVAVANLYVTAPGLCQPVTTGSEYAGSVVIEEIEP